MAQISIVSGVLTYSWNDDVGGAPPFIDVTAPNGPVDIQVSSQQDRVWVNVGGRCLLRICRIKGGVTVA